MPFTLKFLRFRPRVKPGAVEHVADDLAIRRSTSTALQEPATFTAVELSSSRPTVVTLCGIVTSAPRMFEA